MTRHSGTYWLFGGLAIVLGGAILLALGSVLSSLAFIIGGLLIGAGILDILF